MAHQGGRVTRAHPNGVRLPGREGSPPSSASRSERGRRRAAEDRRQDGRAAGAPYNTRGAPAARLRPEAIGAFDAHVKAMRLPMAKMAVATLSARPVGGKKDTSVKAVEANAPMKIMRSMTGAYS